MGIFGKSADKRGNTTGGSSSGRSGQKRGGKDATANPHTSIDQGLLTCPKCTGSGSIGVPRYETITHVDEAGRTVETERFDGEDVVDCTKCGGSGKVKKR